MKTVVVSWSSKPQVFTGGEADGPFTVKLKNHDGTGDDVAQKSPSSPATFQNVPAGDYTATVSKLGVDSSADFTVSAEDQTFDVPDVVTVNVVGGEPVAG